MKKFYIPIFTAALFLISFWSLGQTYNSINPNLGPYSFDDGRYWVGGIPPPNPCSGCTININSNVTMVQSGNSTALYKNLFSKQTPIGTLFSGQPVTLGMRFQATGGYAYGASFYKITGMGGTHTGLLYDNTGTQIASVVFSSETATGWQTQNFSSPVLLTPGATYMIAVYYDDGNYTGDNGYFAASGATNGNLTAPQDGSGGLSNGAYLYSGATPAFPTQTYLSTNYWVDVNYSQNLGGPYYGVFTGSNPGGVLINGQPVTLGMRFQSSIAGNVLGARFFKVAGMNGPHTGVLYDNTGTLLASVVFSGETASGWQSMNFAAPVAISAGTTYVMAIFYADGNYTVDNGFFASSGVTNGSLTGLQDGSPNHNGIYLYGATPQFPTQTYLSSNYWVDLNFSSSSYPALNDMVFDNSTININGNTTLTVNTYVELKNNSHLIIGTNPSSGGVMVLNDQMDLSDASSGIQLGNGSSYINTINLSGNPIIGPHDDYNNPGFPISGIYSVLSAPVNGYDYSWVLSAEGIGFNQIALPPPTLQLPGYGSLPTPLNCSGSGGCAPGFVSGPATTGPDPLAGPLQNLGIIFSSSSILPVQLVQFLASRKDDGSVLLSWATSQEENAGYFDVERSSDQSGWLKLGSVKAKGNSSITTNYSFSDRLPLDGAGYYRLKMVDLDGKFKYSKTVVVNTDNNSQALVVYSNPFTDQIRLKVNVSRSQNLILSVSDMLGKTYISKSYQAQSGDNLINLPSGVGGSGIYVLHIHGDSYDQTVKLQKY